MATSGAKAVLFASLLLLSARAHPTSLTTTAGASKSFQTTLLPESEEELSNKHVSSSEASAIQIRLHSKQRILKQGGKENKVSVPGAINRANSVGLLKLNTLRNAMAKQGVTAFFRLMDSSGFTPVVTDLLARYQVTFLLPQDAAVASAFKTLNRLSKDQQKQVVGYHILTKFYAHNFLVSLPAKTEFPTADYDYTLAKASQPWVWRVWFAPPKAKAPVGFIWQPRAFVNTPRNLIAHVITAVIFPPKYN